MQSGQGWAFTSALCLVRYPELLEGTQVISLTKGANARYLSLVCRNNELGDWPAKIADICRSIYADDVVGQMVAIAPWLDQQAFPINEMPAI